VLGVSLGAIARWKNGHMQPSLLALRQICALVEELSQSSSETLQPLSKQLLAQFF
jgi:putative transcriptional regulator